MTLAQRVRDFRYTKGWGPDDLAKRAGISRTALYQIESGKTEQPRAKTVRQIAEALSVPTESLLGQAGGLGTIGVPSAGELPSLAMSDSLSDPDLVPNSAWVVLSRDREVSRKVQVLLHSPLGEGIARIIEESYRLIPSRSEAHR